MRRPRSVWLVVLSLSVFIHLLFLFAFLTQPSKEQKRKVVNTINVKIQPPKKNIPQPKPTKIEKPEEKQSIKKQPKIDEYRDLPDEYKSGDEAISLNSALTEKESVDSGQIEGERVQTLKKKSRESAADHEDLGVISTTSEAMQKVEKAEVGNLSKEVVISDLYNLDGGYDDEGNLSDGDSEQGVESSIAIEHSTEEQFKRSPKAGNTYLLNDSELNDSFVKDPLSEKRSKEVRIINKYFKQLAELLEARWENPLTPSQRLARTEVRIRITLNELGFIAEREIYLQSDFPELDKSILKALDELSSYQLDWHESYLIKYRYLMLTWTGSGRKYELLPYEKND